MFPRNRDGSQPPGPSLALSAGTIVRIEKIDVTDNDQCPMTNDKCPMPKPKAHKGLIGHWDLVIGHCRLVISRPLLAGSASLL